MSTQAKEICAGVHTLHDESLELAESVVFMAKKLKEARQILKNEPLVIEYDNGGGQSGIRENPNFTAYEHLLSAFNKSLRQLTEIVENGTPTQKASGIMNELRLIAGKKVG